MAYTLIVEDIRERTLVDRQAIAIRLALGAENETVPDVETEIARFDELLHDETRPGDVDPERYDELRALGLRR